MVRLGVGHACDNSNYEQFDNLPFAINWAQTKKLAEEQGLTAVVLDGIDKLPEKIRPPQLILLQWIGEVLQEYETRYQAYQKVISNLAGFYNLYGIKMMVMKGYACSLDWPKPEHRPCGDIDIWQFGKQKEADELLKKKKGIPVDVGHHQHTVFEWGEFVVENHYDFINTHSSNSNKELESILKKLAMDDRFFVDVQGEKLYLPSANFNALFLLRHMLLHFVAVGVNLRTVLDWGFFWQKHGKLVDVIWLDSILAKFRMKEFFNTINAICVEDLGFTSEIFPSVHFLPEIKEQVLHEILSPEYNRQDVHISNLFKRLIFKIKRWRASEWKRKLFLKENTFTILIWSIKSHLLKPGTI